jgi:hypothetical protein
VPGDCCQASDCGAGTDAGPAGYLCQSNQCVNVAANLSGLLWKLPCTGDASTAACYTLANTSMSTALGGAPGVTYSVTVHLRGVVEEKTYTGGCADGYWSAHGTPATDNWNVYRLTVSSPPQTFFLNTGVSNLNYVDAIDYVATIVVDAGATVTLYADSTEGQQIKNIDKVGTPISISGTSVAQPYDGQFIQMDVESVTPALGFTGNSGSALKFNGSQFATVAQAASLQPTDVTTEAWFQFAGATGGWNSIFGKAYGSGSEDSYTIWYQGGVLNAGINVSSPSGATSTNWSALNEWHHMALSYDSGKKMQTLYIDGLPVSCAASAGPIAYDSHDVLIGGDIDNGSLGGFWNGVLDDVRIFSTARTPAEVWADMHTHSLGSTAGLVGEWTFDEGSGQTTADSSGTGNSAVLGATSSAESTDPTWVTSTAP